MPQPDDLDLTAQLSELQTLALTVYGEARGESVYGRIAVGCTVRNRVAANKARWGLNSYKQVCLKAWQFSCWLPAGGADNYATVMEAARVLLGGERPGPVLRECLWVAEGVMTDRLQDCVSGATHYFAPAAMKPAGKVPEWANGLYHVAQIGSHLFYAGVR